MCNQVTIKYAVIIMFITAINYILGTYNPIITFNRSLTTIIININCMKVIERMLLNGCRSTEFIIIEFQYYNLKIVSLTLYIWLLNHNMVCGITCVQVLSCINT